MEDTYPHVGRKLTLVYLTLKIWDKGGVGGGFQPQVGGILSSSDINAFLVEKYGIELYGLMFLKFSWFRANGGEASPAYDQDWIIF